MKVKSLVSDFVDGCGATFSMEDLPEDDEDNVDEGAADSAANQDLLKVEMGEDLAEALRKLCSQQQQFTLPPSPVSNESEGTCLVLFRGGTKC